MSWKACGMETQRKCRCNDMLAPIHASAVETPPPPSPHGIKGADTCIRNPGKLFNSSSKYQRLPFYQQKKMAASSYHNRSNSFPNRPHPLNIELEKQLRRLRSSEATSTSSSSISHQLNDLQDLHDCVDKSLLLPLTHQSIGQGQNAKLVDELLDGSLRVLDVCDIARDALIQIKECSLELKSILRRRGEVETEARKYSNSMKAVIKSTKKALGKLRNTEASASPEKKHDSNETFNMLKEVEATTFMVFESLLSFVSSSRKAPAKVSGWLLVSKLVKTKRIASEEGEDTNEFQKVEAAVYSLISIKKQKSDTSKHVEDLQNQFTDLELCIQELEGGLESLRRRLIKTRVSLLNIANH